MQLVALRIRDAESLGQQLDRIAVRGAPQTALERADPVGTHPRALGKLILREADANAQPAQRTIPNGEGTLVAHSTANCTDEPYGCRWSASARSWIIGGGSAQSRPSICRWRADAP